MIIICCILALIVCAFILIAYLIKISCYEKVEAQILYTYTKSYIRPGSKAHFIKYEYYFNGEKYQTEKQIFIKSGKKWGDIVYIRCNPQSPEEIEDTAMVQTCYFLMSFLCLIIFLLIKKPSHR